MNSLRFKQDTLTSHKTRLIDYKCSYVKVHICVGHWKMYILRLTRKQLKSFLLSYGNAERVTNRNAYHGERFAFPYNTITKGASHHDVKIRHDTQTRLSYVAGSAMVMMPIVTSALLFQSSSRLFNLFTCPSSGNWNQACLRRVNSP